MFYKFSYLQKRPPFLILIIATIAFASFPHSKAIAQQTTNHSLNYTISWLGNTYGKGGKITDSSAYWVQDYIRCIYVTKGGTVYTNSEWDEGGRQYGTYKEGKVIGNKKKEINCKKTGEFKIQGDSIVSDHLVISNCGKPVAIAMGRGPYKGKLLVADNSIRKQILIYDLSGKKAVMIEKVGAPGGIGSTYHATYNFPKAIHSPAYPKGNYPPGYYHPLKFWTLSGVGMDSLGRLFVATTGGGTTIRCFKKDNKNRWILDWTVQDLTFVDDADADKTTDAKDVYGVQEHYILNYNKHTQGSEWTLKSYTLDKDRYPHDPRGILNVKAGHEHGLTSVLIRHVFGRRFLFMNGMTCQWTYIFRFIKNTDVAVPSGVIAKSHRLYDLHPDVFYPPLMPNDGKSYIWRDMNGDVNYQSNEYIYTGFGHTAAWWIDNEGGIWGAKGNMIHCYIPAGLDKNGNLIYNDTHSKTFTILGIKTIGKIIYEEKEDRMVLLTTSCRTLKGGKIYTISNWSKGNRKAVFLCSLKSPNPSSVAAVNNYFFEAGWQSRGKVWITDLRTGATVGTMEPYGKAGTTQYTGWVDIGFGITAVRKKNGEYIIFVEDDGFGKVLMYRWTP
jgi:hypothetical protein